ncbi:MAG: hypothetical protein SGJ27_23490 [Candidatus Melainabacteria bacterium]|nr:hypothetical protein [Candidatus Melainabacteria bacterium]
MIGSVVAVVSSPWYSAYFNQSLKEQSLENYRVSGPFLRSASSAQLARIFHKPGLDIGLEIHADEQIALESIARRTGNLKQIVSNLRHHVESVRHVSDTTSNIADIALLKLIRVELAAADLYLAQGAYPRAQALVTAATADLKRQNSLFEEEPQRFNLQKIFDLTARINHAEGDLDGEQRARALKATLANPAAASEWFRTHGMKGYDGSYPSEFLIKTLLSGDNKNSRITTLTQALEVCKRPNVRLSTRTVVMQTAFNEAETLHAPALSNAVVNFWITHCANNPVRFKPEAMLVFTLKDKMVRSGTTESRLLIRSKVKESIEKKLLSKDCEKMYFDSYESDQILCGLWPLKSPEAAVISLNEIDGLLDLCHKSGCDDFSLQVSRLVALSCTSRAAEAEKLFYEILDRMRTSSSAESKKDQIRVIHALPAVANLLGKPFTPEVLTAV